MNKIKVAIIGLSSSMGTMHVNGVLKSENAELYAICDKDEALLEKRKAEYPTATLAVTDYRELVNRPEIDLAVLVVPDQLHLEMTKAFLEAGKHVLCEKPMALRMEECQEMIDIQKKTGKMLMIGQVCRMTPAFIQAKEIVDSGRIGDLYFVESEYAHCYEQVRGADDWRVTPERSGFIGGGCHAVDLLRWIAGDPTEVTAYSNHKCLTDWPADDCTIGIYKFPNNVIGKVFASIGCRRNYTMRTVLYGTKGTIICDNTSDTMQLFTTDEPLPDGTLSYRTPQIIPVNVNSHNTTAEITQFIEAIRAGKESPCSPIEGASTIAVCCATVESAAQGRTVMIKYPKA